jgi:hypothetical protein
LPKNLQRQQLVDAALAGSESAEEDLHALCSDVDSAQKVSEILLALPTEKNDAIEPWLQVIAEMHPTLAADIGAKLRRRLGVN